MPAKTFQEFDINDEVEERRSLLPVKRVTRKIVTRSSYSWRGVIVAAILFVWWSWFVLSEIYDIGVGKVSFDKNTYLNYEDIIPSEKLRWYPCFPEYGSTFKCARLTVPMDYHRPLNASQDNPKVHIALIMLPGKHSGSKQFSKSPLLTNPGGPGGRGVDFILSAGRLIQTVVGEDQDVIGFDPRGVGATMPRVDCFSYGYGSKNSTYDGTGDDYARGDFHRTLFTATTAGIGIPNSSTTALRLLDARAKTLGKLCEEKDSLNGKDSIFRYVHTPSVATDMLSILDAWDEWTASITRNSSSCADFGLESPDESDEVRLNEPSLDTKGKLVYWGLSYGTLLGSTFASMFPDRVGRLVLDGVVDADHYVSQTWSGSQLDIDKEWASFFRYCHLARFSCKFYRNGDHADDIESRYEAVMENLKQTPFPLVLQDTMTPLIITYSDTKVLIFQALYAPIIGFEMIAAWLDVLERDMGDDLGLMIPTPPTYDYKPVCESIRPQRTYPHDAQRAILCGDKRHPFNRTYSEIEDMFEELAAESSFGDVWMSVTMQCSGYNIESIDPPMRWDDNPAHKQKPIKTAFPLLYISNSKDPVTPLLSGVKMASKFVDAGLIEQQSEGHCSLSAKSRCTIQKIRAYFKEGQVPAAPIPGKDGDLLDGEWEKCIADEWPWNRWSEASEMGGDFEAAEVEQLKAWGGIADAFNEVNLWGRNDVKPVDIRL